MKVKAACVALAACIATAVPAAGVASAAKKKPTGPLVVGVDPKGDWGDGSNNAIGDALGQDLVEAAIEQVDATTINFIIKVNSLPPTGGTPEVTRYLWDFFVDKEELELDGKFTNYSRGACDPTSGQCPPPRDPGMQPFLLRGNCTVQPTPVTNLTVCEELARIQAKFDAGAGTITIPVPIDALKAKPGSKIVGRAGTFGGTIAAVPAAFVSSTAFPLDNLVTTKTFVVRK
ncbi:MAG: hypothetical protein M3174_00475 [Actinomycetota bacterium]|nr:hypothetical protein [Actinomycetota bacterium]